MYAPDMFITGRSEQMRETAAVSGMNLSLSTVGIQRSSPSLRMPFATMARAVNAIPTLKTRPSDARIPPLPPSDDAEG